MEGSQDPQGGHSETKSKSESPRNVRSSWSLQTGPEPQSEAGPSGPRWAGRPLLFVCQGWQDGVHAASRNLSLNQIQEVSGCAAAMQFGRAPNADATLAAIASNVGASGPQTKGGCLMVVAI